MTNSIKVKCLIHRYWVPEILDYDGDTAWGDLIEISSQSDEADPAKLISAGIVMVKECEDSIAVGTFQHVPMEFIWVDED